LPAAAPELQNHQGRGRGVHIDGRGGIRHQPAPLLALSADDVLEHGLQYVGFDKGRQSNVAKKKNKERFRASFGIGNEAVAALLKDIQTSKRARVENVDLKYFFLALNFLKTYSTELVLSGWWDLHEDTVHKWSWYYIQKFQQLKEEKVGSFRWTCLIQMVIFS
jgi:hypothetical protein